MKIDQWEIDEASEDFIKRFNKAKEKKCTPISVDAISKCAIFHGSNDRLYHTSLQHCECKDFAMKKQPCKHIYRLAMELGLIDCDAKYSLPNDYDFIKSICSFASWRETTDINQFKRFVRAEECECVSIDADQMTALFLGEKEVYETSLLSCNCADFINRLQPCKHIYRLAKLLNVVKNDGTSGTVNANITAYDRLSNDDYNNFRLIIEKIRPYSDDLKNLIIQSIVGSKHGLKTICKDTSEICCAIQDGILEISNEEIPDKEILKKIGQKKTVYKLESIGYTFPENVKLQREKFAYCLDHADEIRHTAFPSCGFVVAPERVMRVAAYICSYMYYTYKIGGVANPINHLVYDKHIVPKEITDMH